MAINSSLEVAPLVIAVAERVVQSRFIGAEVEIANRCVFQQNLGVEAL